MPDTLNITFNLHIQSTDKKCSFVKSPDTEMVKKRLLILGSKEIDTINSAGIYDIYKDLHLNEKECEGCLKV